LESQKKLGTKVILCIFKQIQLNLQFSDAEAIRNSPSLGSSQSIQTSEVA